MKTESITLTPKNIDSVIKQIKKKLDDISPESDGLLVPAYIRTDKIDRTSYRGRGRTSYRDYIYEDFVKTFKEPINK